MEGLRDKLFDKIIKLKEETNMLSALLLMLTTVIENGKQAKPDDDSSDEDTDDDSIGSDGDSIQACDIKFN